MKLLRARFEALAASWEAHERLARHPGLRYLRADVSDPADAARAVGEVLAEHGRLDLIVHGAGVQRSARLERRTLAMVRETLAVKLGGAHHLLDAAARAVGRPVPLHALTSAFSVLGNDGQADYGAANEGLDRLCAQGRAAHGPGWGSVAWLAWDGIGMTRGSEYRVLAQQRALHALGPAAGRALFARALASDVPTHVPLTEAEIARYGVTIAAPPPSEPLPDQRPPAWAHHHTVRGQPTLPGAFALGRLLHAVGAEPDAPAVLEQIRFDRFVRWTEQTVPHLRTEAAPDGDAFHARLTGDLAHHSGHLLQQDLSFCEARVRLVPLDDDVPRLLDCTGRTAADPYCKRGSVRLSGPFDRLRDIVIGEQGRAAWFDGADLPADLLPHLLLDAAWRLGAMHAEGSTTSSTSRSPSAAWRSTAP
ncbi:MAG: SDR family oxidoreductase [Myxococcota bacterium]